MEKIKHVFSHSQRKSTDATHEGSSSPTGADKHTNTAVPSDPGGHSANSEESQHRGTSGSDEYHPIFDEMTGHSPPAASSNESARATEQPPRFPNASNLKPESGPASNLHPTTPTAAGKQPPLTEGGSTASIKSGVVGQPQLHGPSSSKNAPSGSQQNDIRGQNQATDLPHNAEDAAGTAGMSHRLHHQRDHDNLRANPEYSNAQGFAQPSNKNTQQPFEQSVRQSGIEPDNDRTFPLAGGVTSTHSAQNPMSTSDSHAVPNEREPGTKDKEAGLNEGHGREKLASAAALAIPGVVAGTHPSVASENDVERERQNKGQGALSGLSGAPTTSADTFRPEHELPSDHHHGQTGVNVPSGATGIPESSNLPQSDVKHRQPSSSDHHPHALAAATAAAAAHSGPWKSEDETEHNHLGHGHTFTGDPCGTDNTPSATVFTSGPHSTDTANRMDPHLHVPGEFPETPMETPLGKKSGGDGYISGRAPESSTVPSGGAISAGSLTNASHEIPSKIPISTHDSNATSAIGPTMSSSHDGPSKIPAPSSYETQGTHDRPSHGKEAAIAGGLGVGGLGAYAANKYRQREPTGVEGHNFPKESSPYSSSKLDPRVNPNAPKMEEQRFDPMARTEPSPHDPNFRSPTSQHTADQPTSQPFTQVQEPESEHHYGRNAALAGAGTAAAGGLYYTSQQNDKPDSSPASSTIGPHKSNIANILDPRARPDPALQKHHQAGPTAEDPASHTIGPHKSNIANIVDPRVQPEPEKQKGHTTTGPHQSDTFNRMDPRVDHKVQPEDQHHYGRDAAAVGGVGAAGYGAYEAARAYGEHRGTQPSAAMTEQRYDPTAPGAHHPPAFTRHHHDLPAQPATSQTTQGVQQPHYMPIGSQGNQQPSTGYDEQPGASHQRYDSVQDTNNNQHQKRDAAALGAAGVAGAGGAYAYSQHEADKAEKERLAQEKAHQKAQEKELEHQRKGEQKELEHQRKAEAKEQEKALEAQQHAFEKEQAKEKKEHDNVVAAENRRHEKEMEKEAEAERERQEEEDGKGKKHGLLGFLHRDKSKKEKREGSAESSPRHSRELAAGGAGAGALGASGYAASQDPDASNGKKHHNKLHKSPPRGHPAREAMEAGKPSHIGRDGKPDHAADSGGLQSGVYDANASSEQGNSVTQPDTELPMNAKYGDGRGGTDAGQTTHGYQQRPNVEGQQRGSLSDWSDETKANMPY